MKKYTNLQEAMDRLEEIVTLMSDENTDIESALKAFEEGTKLIGICRKKLESAKLKINELSESEQDDLNE